jgi:hypothetical protein
MGATNRLVFERYSKGIRIAFVVMVSENVKLSPDGALVFLHKATLLIVKCCAVKLKEEKCGCLYLSPETLTLEA